MSRPTILLVAGLLLLAGCTGGAPSTAEQAQRLESQVWSPYCPGRLLADCTTQQSHELRTEIAERLDAGQSPDEVLTWLEANYGEEILARPGDDPLGLALWLVPGLLLLAGAAVTLLLIRRFHGRAAGEVPSPHAPDDPWIARARDEVREDR